jgi:hypothetical protein
VLITNDLCKRDQSTERQRPDLPPPELSISRIHVPNSPLQGPRLGQGTKNNPFGTIVIPWTGILAMAPVDMST